MFVCVREGEGGSGDNTEAGGDTGWHPNTSAEVLLHEISDQQEQSFPQWGRHSAHRKFHELKSSSSWSLCLQEDTELPSYSEATTEPSEKAPARQVTVTLVDGATQTSADQDQSPVEEPEEEPAVQEVQEVTSPSPPPPRFRFLRFGNKNNW